MKITDKKEKRILKHVYEHKLITTNQARDLLSPFFSSDKYRKAVQVLRDLEEKNLLFFIKAETGYYRASDQRATFADDNQLKMF